MSTKQTEALKLALEAAYLAGFNASGEGYNGEYPFQDYNAHPAQDEGWRQNRDAYIREALAEQPAQQEPVAIALNTGTKQGVKWLRNVEHGKHLYTSPPASKPWVGLTLDDRKKLRDQFEDWNYPSVLLSAVENILREKNNG